MVIAVQIDQILRGMGEQLVGVDRCPHCSVAKPLLQRVWASPGPMPRTDGGPQFYWGSYRCTVCGAIVTAAAVPHGEGFIVRSLFPESKTAHEDIPEIARKFLQQAYETLHAPDAAAVMAGSAVDAMLKKKNYVDGTLYVRIDKATADGVLTKGMADWAHSVRLGSNRPRHADADNPHVTVDEATQSVEFAEALGNFLFVLTAKVERGLIASGAKPAP